MEKSVKVLVAAAFLALLFGFPTATHAEEFTYAKRVALGLQGGSLSFGPTIEYWPSDKLDLSANVGWFFNYSSLMVRGTYLFEKPINIFGDFPARPYVGAGVGYRGYFFVSGYSAWGGPGLQVFGGLMQPLTKNWNLRGELLGEYYVINWPGGYTETGGFPLGVNFGIFYHFGK